MRAPRRVPASGFVLAGGRSTRMGTDKALLMRNGRTFLEQIAAAVQEATGNVTIIADPTRYARFGWPVIPDGVPGRGPLGGIVTALDTSPNDWNLITACDMPGLDAGFLGTLLDRAVDMGDGLECLAPLSASGPEPLCAVYHRRALPKMRECLDRNILKMMTVLSLLPVRYEPAAGEMRFANINTPEDWLIHE